MLWLILVFILWIIGGGLTICMMIVAKRADELAEAMYEREILKVNEQKAIVGVK